ncbi:MAG: deoxyribonuclease V [Planctomycetota bacterium]|nr:deoxyribonuclease V [Planctomycetota bacterium]
MMRGKSDAGWPELLQRWKAEQNELRQRIVVQPLGELPRYIGGADAAFSGDKRTIYAVAVVYDREEKRIVEVAESVREVIVPYVPGFLSFREGPAILEAVGKLKHEWGVICFDGQGYAHPRRCGVAAHLGITLDRPGVGVAKSRLVGMFEEPEESAGSMSPLMDRGEQIGMVLRTKDRVRPLFVSVGHRVDIESSCRLVMACCTRYRVPEPTRQADIEVAKLKRRYEGREC